MARPGMESSRAILLIISQLAAWLGSADRTCEDGREPPHQRGRWRMHRRERAALAAGCGHVLARSRRGLDLGPWGRALQSPTVTARGLRMVGSITPVTSIDHDGSDSVFAADVELCGPGETEGAHHPARAQSRRALEPGRNPRAASVRLEGDCVCGQRRRGPGRGAEAQKRDVAGHRLLNRLQRTQRWYGRPSANRVDQDDILEEAAARSPHVRSLGRPSEASLRLRRDAACRYARLLLCPGPPSARHKVLTLRARGATRSPVTALLPALGQAGEDGSGWRVHVNITRRGLRA